MFKALKSQFTRCFVAGFAVGAAILYSMQPADFRADIATHAAQTLAGVHHTIA